MYTEMHDSEKVMRIENIPEFYPSGSRSTLKLERAFLEEMVKYVVPQPQGGAFSGGVGEEQFASFLNSEYAAALSHRIHLGLEIPHDE